MYSVISSRFADSTDNNDYITDGVTNDPSVINNPGAAVLYTFPITAYGFLGLEILTVTAYEARDVASLRWPSMLLPVVVFALYFMITMGEAVNVSWLYEGLPPIYAGIGSKPSDNASNPTNPRSNSLVIIAVWKAGYPTLCGFLNGCLIFSALSTANTSLYVASRTLFGLTRNMRNNTSVNPIIKLLRGFTLLDRRVPVVALFVSWLAFLWLPYLQLIRKLPVAEFLEIMSISGSVACIIVWGSVCLAYIRYESWIRNCAVDLETEAPRYWRRSGFASYGSWTFFFGIQPAPAYLGLAGCLLVIASASATWWSEPASFGKAAIAYAAPVVFVVIFILTKIVRGTLFKRWGVRLGRNVGVLINVLENLELNRPVERKRADSTKTGGITPSPQGTRPNTDEPDRVTIGAESTRPRGGSGATGEEIELGRVGSRGSPHLEPLHHAGTWRMGRDQSPSRQTPTLLDVPGSAH
jgi:amino acid transporter